MQEIDIHLRISPGVLLTILPAAFLSLCAMEVASENVTMTTYYPAPSGVYSQMITTGTTYLARDSRGAVVVAGSTPNPGGTPGDLTVAKSVWFGASGPYRVTPRGDAVLNAASVRGNISAGNEISGGSLNAWGSLPGWPGMSAYTAGNIYSNGDVYLANPHYGSPRWASAPAPASPVKSYTWGNGYVASDWSGTSGCNNGDVVTRVSVLNRNGNAYIQVNCAPIWSH